MPKTKQPMYGVFPVKGLRVTRFAVAEHIFSRPWTLVDFDQLADLDHALHDSGGFKGNLDQLVTRLGATAFLVVREYVEANASWQSWRELSDVANSVIAALNFVALAQSPPNRHGADEHGTLRGLPDPIWIPKFREACELPIIFDREKLRTVGHSEPISWGSHVAELGDPSSWFSNERLDHLLALAPSHVSSVIEFPQKSNSSANCLRALANAFNCTSIGQFCAQSLGALDILFGEAETTRWELMQDYIVTLCGPHTTATVKHLFKIRHRFVHRQAEPADKGCHLKCLALVVSTIAVFEHIVESSGGKRDAAKHNIQAAMHLNKAMSFAPNPPLDKIPTASLKTVAPPLWARDWLDDELTQPAGNTP